MSESEVASDVVHWTIHQVEVEVVVEGGLNDFGASSLHLLDYSLEAGLRGVEAPCDNELPDETDC